MGRRPRTRAALAALAVLPVIAASASVTGDAAAAAKPVRVAAAFDRDARLGSSSALAISLRLDPNRFASTQLTEVRLAYPRSLGLVSSGLGLAPCTRPPEDFVRVLIDAPGLGGCPANAVMGTGTVFALVRLTDGQVIPEYATITLLSGTLERGRLGLVVFVDGQRPFGAKLAFAGEVRGAGGPYGGALSVSMPPIPGIRELATISLVELRIVVGAHAIRYYERRHGRRVAYHPEGVELPTACPAGGFRFQAQVAFADGTRRSASSVTRCPRAVASPPAPR
jgi:hypothetical protein